MAVKRIQRRRTKGWRMPEGAVYVGRPSRWGNPYEAGKPPYPNHLGGGVFPCDCPPLTTERAVSMFASMAARVRRGRDEWLEPLRGRDLVCWCPLDQPCHGDVLLELANPSPHSSQASP